MKTLPAALIACLMASISLHAAEPVADRQHYYDEESRRYLTLEKADFSNTRVSIRFAGDPGSMNVWVGQGQRQDRQLLFARQVNEGEERGTFFIAEISESKVKIGYKPGQREPMDAGINGEYRRASDTKYLQLIKKEFQSANERLIESLKAATKTWQATDRPALALWKDQWPALRQRWQTAALGLPPATEAALAGKAGSDNEDKTAAYWLSLAQATAQGYYFLGTLPDPATSLGWDGEYDDLGGGHASLRMSQDGKLRLTLSSLRVGESEAATLDATASGEHLQTAKDGRLTADFTVTDAEVKDPAQQARVRLSKWGRYLQIETQQTQRYAGQGWFDGIYRGSPVPRG